MLSAEGSARLAEIEYKRDGNFRTVVDMKIEELANSGYITRGQPLGSILGLPVEGGQQLGAVLLAAYWGRTSQPQWLRARELESHGKRFYRKR